jgi:hypothetical protein
MNLRVIFAACTIAAFGSFLMTFDAPGQKQSLKEKLVGTWLQVSVDVVSSDGDQAGSDTRVACRLRDYIAWPTWPAGKAQREERRCRSWR